MSAAGANNLPFAPARLLRSEGLLVAKHDEGAAVNDLVTDQVHSLRLAATLVVEATPIALSSVLSAANQAAGGMSTDLTAGVTRGVEALIEFGLLNREQLYSPPHPVNGSARTPVGSSISQHCPILDRLLHHAVVVVATQGESYRMKQAHTRGAPTKTTTT